MSRMMKYKFERHDLFPLAPPNGALILFALQLCGR